MGRHEFTPGRPDAIESPNLSDEQLMAGVADGRADALQGLLDRHWSGLVAYAVRAVGSPDEARDIAQEVFVRVWEYRARWKPGGSSRAYLYQIARNLVRLRSRHLEVRERHADHVRTLAPRNPTPLEDLSRSELRKALDEALASLPERRREAFVLVRLRGLCLQEAAEVMGVTRRTVANHLYRAVGELEQRLTVFQR